jgi:hypothetical protein
VSYRRAAAMLVGQPAGRSSVPALRADALAENDVQLPLLMAKSRHRSLRTLHRYARLGPDAVAALTAAHDPGRRR